MEKNTLSYNQRNMVPYFCYMVLHEQKEVFVISSDGVNSEGIKDNSKIIFLIS